MSYAVWIALAVVLIAVLPAILRGKKGGDSGDATISDGGSPDRDGSDSDSSGGGDGGDSGD
jgi:hypothetical protein